MIQPILRLTVTLTIFCIGLFGLSMFLGRVIHAPMLVFSADLEFWLLDLRFEKQAVFNALDDRLFIGNEQFSASPDGTKLAFILFRHNPDNLNSPIYELATLDLPSGELTTLRSSTLAKNSPEWSPDGATIAFTENAIDIEGAHLYVLPVHQPDKARVVYSSPSRESIFATWSRDSAALILEGDRPSGGTEVIRLDVQTEAIQTLLPRMAFSPLYSPDGKHLALWIPAFEGYALAVWQEGMDFPKPISSTFLNPSAFIWLSNDTLAVVVQEGIQKFTLDNAPPTTLMILRPEFTFIDDLNILP